MDLVPLLGWMRLRGKCRACGAAIDPTHLPVEVASIVIGAMCGAWAVGPWALAWTLIGVVLITLAIIDFRHFWLPDALTLPLIAAGLTVGLWMTDVALEDRIIGAGAGYGALALLAVVYRRLRGREGLGLGDAKLLAAIGAWLGWQALPMVLLAGSVIGLLAALLFRVRGEDIGANTALPLGTCFIVGLPVAIGMMVLLNQ